MRTMRRLGVSLAGVLFAIAVATAAAPAATAESPVAPLIDAAGIPVYQIPATGTAVSGLVVPGPWWGSVNAETTGTTGETLFSVPASQEICATTAGGSLVRIGYLNLTNGIRGSVLVKPCEFSFLDPVPTHAVAHTGSGPVAVNAEITGSAAYPRAGTPSLPGVGMFVAP